MTEVYQRNGFIPNDLEDSVHSLEMRLNEPIYLDSCHEAIQNIIKLMTGEESVDPAVNPELNQENNDIVIQENDDDVVENID